MGACNDKDINNLDKNFLMMNGDILTDLNFKELFNVHKNKKADLTIATHRRTQEINYGTLEYNHEGFLTKFIEKPSIPFSVSMGVYIISRSVIRLIPKKGRFDFPDLVQKILAEKMPVYCHSYDGYWMDIGRPEDYEQAIDDYEIIKDRL